MAMEASLSKSPIALTLALSLAGCPYMTEEQYDSYMDADSDGFSGLQDGDDCDDHDAEVNPDAEEVCGDGIDNNCDGAVDDDGVGGGVFYADADRDGYGDPTTALSACEAPVGWVTNGDDCDDLNYGTAPGSVELCDRLDNDCDDDIDEGILGTAPECPAASCAEAYAEYGAEAADYYLELDPGVDLYPCQEDWLVVSGLSLLSVEFWTSEATTADQYEADVVEDFVSLFLDGVADATCNPLFVRADATLPTSFTEVKGSWSASTGIDESHDDVVAGRWDGAWDAVPPVSPPSDCPGFLIWGTPDVRLKAGGEWGSDWSLSKTWDQSPTTVPETSILRWGVREDGLGTTTEQVLLHDIQLYVR